MGYEWNWFRISIESFSGITRNGTIIVEGVSHQVSDISVQMNFAKIIIKYWRDNNYRKNEGFILMDY